MGANKEAQGRQWAALDQLVQGLVRAEISKGEEFVYDGARLYPEEVSDILLPSMMCLADGVSRYVGLGTSGYEYGLESDGRSAFPLYAKPPEEAVSFHRVAPFVVEVFDSFVLENRADVTRVFEKAAQSLNAEFSLERDARMSDEAEHIPERSR